MSVSNVYASKLDNAHVLIIGGSSGIGLAVACAALCQKAKVTISSSSASKISSSISSLKEAFPNGQLYGHACNLAADDMEASIADLLDKTAKEGGELNHIVYTAADKLSICPVSEITAEKIVAAGKLRFQGPLLLAKHATKHLPKNASSSITYTSGSVASKPYPDWAMIGGYAAALEGITRSLAVDLKPIRVNVVEPGATDTGLWDMPAAEYEEFKRRCADASLTGEMGQVEDVAEAYLYCLRSRNVNGAILKTDGGSTIM